MKTKNIFLRTTVLLSLSIACTLGAAYGQAGTKNKSSHKENRIVTKHGKDSTVTIMTEDIDNGRVEKKTLIIHNGDTTSNIVMSENYNGSRKNGTSVIIDGDSIIKIDRIPDLPELPDLPNMPGIKNIKIGKKRVIIVNGDSIMVQPDGENIKITIDTAIIREKCTTNKSFKDASKKSIVMSDKYIIINTNKLSHKDSSQTKWHNVVAKVGLEGFDLGFTFFMDQSKIGVSQTNKMLDISSSKSANVNFRVLDLRVNLIKYKLYLNAGIEFDLHDYGFVNNVTLNSNAEKFSYYKDSTANFSRDKLSTQYLELPLMFCFVSNPNHPQKAIDFAIGAYGGLLLGAYTKQVSPERGEQRIFNNFNVNPIDYGVMAQIGAGGIDCFVKYNMSPIFQTSSGAPNLQSLTVGIKLFHPFRWH